MSDINARLRGALLSSMIPKPTVKDMTEAERAMLQGGLDVYEDFFRVLRNWLFIECRLTPEQIEEEISNLRGLPFKTLPEAIFRVVVFHNPK